MRWSVLALAACGRLGFDEAAPDPIGPDTVLRDDCDVAVDLPAAPGSTVEVVASDARAIAVIATRGAGVEVAILVRDAGLLRGVGSRTFELPDRALVTAVFDGDRLVIARSDRADPNTDLAILDAALGVTLVAYPDWGIDSLTVVDGGVLGIGREPDGEMLGRLLGASGQVIVDDIRPDSGTEWGRTSAAPLGNGAALIVHDHRGSNDDACDIALFSPIDVLNGFTVEDEPCRAADVAYNAASDRQAVVYEGLDDRVRFRPVRNLQPNAGPEIVIADAGIEPAIAVAGDSFVAAFEVVPRALEVVALDATGAPVANPARVTASFDRWWLDGGADARLSWATGNVATTRRVCP